MPAPSSIPCLVVDDQQTMRSLVRTGLQQLGFRTIHEAADGEDGLRHMLSRPVRHTFASAQMSSVPARPWGSVNAVTAGNLRRCLGGVESHLALHSA